MDLADLARLSDLDFEAVVGDLYELLLGKRLELFAPGADEGVDLRHFKGEDRLVIQCKHWLRSSGSKLVSALVAKERAKVERLDPTRYILVTSADLSARQKERLFSEFQPWILDREDIVAGRNLVADLERHSDVVRRHLRLWLSSDALLRAAVQRPTAVRSVALVDEIRDAVRLWVDVGSRSRARALLDERHVVVIAGIPGIGKTTLAKILCAEYAEHEGYEIVDVSQDIDEANGFWSDDARQLFFYDDFLGQTTLREKLGHNADSRLVRFMRRVERDAQKRLVLTTREYILAQAKTTHEPLHNTDFDVWKCVVPLADYTRELRARMIYNHVYFSDLSASAKRAFARLDASLPIVEHHNFSPRLLDGAITQAARSGFTGKAAVALIRESFDHPNHLWEHIVREQLDDCARELLFLLAVVPTPASWRELVVLLDRLQGVTRDRALERAVRATDGNLTTTHASRDETTVDLHNPSILDYLGEELGENPSLLSRILTTASRFEIVYGVWRLRDHASMAAAIQAQQSDFVAAADRTLDALPMQNSWGTVRLQPATAVDWADRFALMAPVAADLDWPDLWELAAKAASNVRHPLDPRLADALKLASRTEDESVQNALYGLLDRAASQIDADANESDLLIAVDMINAVEHRLDLHDVKSVIARRAKEIVESRVPEPEAISDELESLAYALLEGWWHGIDKERLEYLAYGRERPSSRKSPDKPPSRTDTSRTEVERILRALADA